MLTIFCLHNRRKINFSMYRFASCKNEALYLTTNDGHTHFLFEKIINAPSFCWHQFAHPQRWVLALA